MENFDLMVIGGGPAGYHGAARAAGGGLKTALIERRALGGVCLNEGCIPSKALLHSAKLYDAALHSEKYGVSTTGATIDHGKVLARKNKVVKVLVAGVRAQMKQSGVEVLSGSANIVERSGEGFVVEVDGVRYGAQRLLLAAGSEPMVPPIQGLSQGLADGFVLTSREILDLPQPPASLVVIGGGVIGLEMASYFSAIGSSVTVVEMQEQIAGPTDREIGKILQKNLAKKGIDFQLGCTVTAVGEDGISFERDGKTQQLAANKVLLSIGRRPSTKHLGLEAIGLATDRGAVATDDRLRTSVPGVWAAGDINGRSMLAHTAYREAEVAVDDILGTLGDERMRYRAVPSVIYTSPEVAGVGETEETAADKGLDVKVVKLPLRYAGRYVAEVEGGDGICKLLLDRSSGLLVGVHMVGSYASEIIYGAAMMIDTKMSPDTAQKVIFPHPTVGEVLREGLHLL